MPLRNTYFWVSRRLLVEEHIPNIGLWWNNFQKKRGIRFFSICLKRAVLDQATGESGGVSRGRSVAMAVGLWLFALQQHFNNTSMALPWHFHDTSMALPQKKDIFCGIVAFICIGREIKCLPCAFFFFGFMAWVICIKMKAVQWFYLITWSNLHILSFVFWKKRKVTILNLKVPWHNFFK